MQHPNVPFNAINLSIPDTTFQSVSQSGQRVSRESGGGSRFSFTLSYPPLSPERAFLLRAFVTSLRGSLNTFTVSIPTMRTPQGTQTADTAVASDTSVGSTSIPINGATPSATFKTGDAVQFSNHTKVYMITTDTSADGGGLATLSISPPLQAGITSATETVKHSGIEFTVYLKNSLQQFKTRVNSFTAFELDVEEEI